MTEPPPRPRVSKRVSPLAVIVVVIVVGLIAIAVMRARHNVETPSGVKVPTSAQPNTVMPRQPDLPIDNTT